MRVVASPSGSDFSVTLTDGSSVPVKGTQVEQPPDQPNGGGLNSSIVTVTPVTPIAAGQSVNVEFTLGVQQAGTFRFFVNAEALSGASPSPAAALSGGVRSGPRRSVRRVSAR